MVSSRKIGIIGGVGPQSTDFIYEKIIEYSQRFYNAKNNSDYPRIAIESVPVPDFISNRDNIPEATTMLEAAAKGLTAGGATRLCIGSNTVHILLKKLQEMTDTPFISMIDLVAAECSNRNFTTVGILGTPVLLNSNLYQEALREKNIDFIVPTKEQLDIVEKIIRKVIAGVVNDDGKAEYIEVLNNMFEQGAQAVILGCTELPLAVNYEALGDRTLNSDAILAKGIVDYYYS